MGTYRMYRLRHSLRLFVLLLTVCLGVSGRLFGQYYPIYATVQWPAPQSPYLADYSTGSRDRLIVTLLNRDQQQPLLYAKLRLQIKSGSFTARSREDVSYPQLELQTSVPLRLTGVDLSPYLQPQHLQMTGRLEQGRLPSGYAELQLQVIDYYTGHPLSDWHTARAYLDVKKPPFLNLPERDAEVVLRDPLFLRFQWTPRHQGLSGTEYEFVLKELPDNGVAPQSAFAYGQEIFRTHTRSTSLSYTHLDPPLLPNRRYAWQVRALVRSGVEEVGMFEHGGLSEVSWFYLNDQCDAPRGLRAQTRYAKVDLSWGKVVGTTGYVVECRPKTKLNVYEWARTETVEERLTLAQLKPGWTYEWRVGTRCTSDRPVFSDVREFTLSKQNEALLADCGKEPVRTDLRGEPHLGIRAGDVVTIGGDYPMTITEVTALGDGWYSGKGKTRLKTLIDAPIALRFDRLRINVDKYQIDGSVEASYDEKRGAIANTDYIDDGGRDLRPATLRLREKQLSFTLPESPQFHFDPGTGTLTVQDAAGNAQHIDLQLPEGEKYKSVFPLLVTDKEGNSYRIQPAVPSTEDDHGTSSHGKVALQSEHVERMGDFDSEALSKKYGQVRFSGQGGRYAFDPGSVSWYQKSVKLDRFYKPFAKDYIAPWKLIPEGEQDVVTAEYTGNKAIDPQRVRFASEPRSTALPASYDASSKRWSVSLPSVSSGESYEVFAVYEGEVLGKLRVASYAQQRHKLTLVPINDAKLDKAQIERELNGVYGSVGIHFDVEVDERMRGDYSWDRDGDRKLSIVGKSFFGRVREVKESAEMDYLKKAYSQLSGTLDGLYLFVVDAAQGLEDKPQSLLGEMPRRSRFGYIFSGNSPNGGTSDLGYTIAHELGHGLFTLQHTFDDEYGGVKSQGQTRNLMDYAAGKELAAFQWNVLANPAVFTAADKAEEVSLHSSESCIVSISPDLSQAIIQSGKAVYAASGQPIHLPPGAIIKGLFYKDTSRNPAPIGSIASFEINGVQYNTYYRVSDSRFAFYGADTTRIFPIEVSRLPIVQIQIDEEERRVTVEGQAFSLTKEAFSCADKVKRPAGAGRFALTRVVKEKISFGTKDWERTQVELKDQEELVEQFAQLARGFTARDNEYLGELLSDKILAYEKLNGCRFIIVTAPTSHLSLSESSWQSFAEAVFQRAGLGKRDILITIPYIRVHALLRDGVVMHMPGLSSGSEAFVDEAKLARGYDPSQSLSAHQAGSTARDVYSFVWDVFTHTRKKLVRRNTLINYQGLILVGKERQEIRTGIPASYQFHLMVDSLYEPFAEEVRLYVSRRDALDKSPNFISRLKQQREALLSYVHTHEVGHILPVIHGLNEYVGQSDPKVCEQYAKWYAYYKAKGIPNIHREDSPRDNCFYEGRNAIIHREILGNFDKASLLLSTVGLDWIADGLGAVYATIEGDTSEGVTRAGFFVFPLVGGGTRTLTTKEIREAVARRELYLQREGERLIVALGKQARNAIDETTKLITSLVEQLLGKLKAPQNVTPSIYSELHKILSEFSPEVLDKLLHIKGVDIVLNDMAQSWRKLQGGKFQLQYFASHLAKGTSIVQFEVKKEVKIGEETVARIYDIVADEGRGKIHYELKNWSSWGTWSGEAFREQFLKDLATMANGKRVKWVFSGQKLNREEVKRRIIEALQDGKWRAPLSSMIRKLPEKSPLKIILGSEVEDIESLVKAIDEHDAIFDFLFDIITL